ncbi:MAG TPA: hypothetical protein VEA61_03760 [Allosphingosinicella sp.]|nr:hypothetical protein [Allosphingosinicella sp.]
MKSVIAGFLTTALLMALHVAPTPDQLQGYASATDKAFAERHAGESKQALEAELGLERR